MSFTQAEKTDLEWLTGGESLSWFESTAAAFERGEDLVGILKRLRKQLSVEKARLILEQFQLRVRAKQKFSLAEQMFFTDKSLQQATGEDIAKYKRQRFAGAPGVVDFCCGIGGDLIHLGAQAPVIGVDLDATVCVFAQANCSANRIDAVVQCGPAMESNLPAEYWAHVDPDRRRSVNSNRDRRATKPELFSPSFDEVGQIVAARRNVAVKIAPASVVHANSLGATCQREWIGNRREAKQQVLWFGELAGFKHDRVATAVDRDGSVIGQFGATDQESPVRTCEQLGEYVYDLHPTMLAAKLGDAFASEQGLARVDRNVAYFTGAAVDHPLASRFKVVEVGKLDRRKLDAMLRANNVGRLEIKRRGVEQHLQDDLAKRSLDGGREMSVLLTRLQGNRVAILAERET